MMPILFTALLLGLSVLVIEVVGARALTPFFGTDLLVWTGIMTATLSALSTGYAVGGRLCRRRPHALPTLFWAAGGWLLLFPIWCSPVLSISASFGVALGALSAALWLFAVPLACLGAASPMLMQRFTPLGVEAGRGLSILLSLESVGGLLGGLSSALLVIPRVPSRVALLVLGGLLVMAGAYWAKKHNMEPHVLLGAFACFAVFTMVPSARNVIQLTTPTQVTAKVVHRAQGATGLVQVVEAPGMWRALYVNGLDQGGIELGYEASLHPYPDYLARMLYLYHPRPMRVLLLGLGSGVLAKALHGLGVQVTVVERDPVVTNSAKKFLALPDGVRVLRDLARSLLEKDGTPYDAIVLDSYARPSTPWHLLTREALESIRGRLAPSGRFLMSTLAQANGENEGLKHVEASLLDVFGEALVFLEPRLPSEGEEVVCATLVAGTRLQRNDAPYRGNVSRAVEPYLGDFMGTVHYPARRGGRIDSDDDSTLEKADRALRFRVREVAMATLGPDVLRD